MRVRFRRGDTLWAYSRIFQVPLPLILDSNALDPVNIAVGQEVEIPGYIVTGYTVKAGDTLWQLARQRGLPVDALLLLNPDVNPDRLAVGSQLNVPLRVTWFIVDTIKPYDSAALQSDLNRLTEIYPFIRRRNIGASVLGKPIPELQIGRGAKTVHVKRLVPRE